MRISPVLAAKINKKTGINKGKRRKTEWGVQTQRKKRQN
jgi:hypothetical protein